MFYLLLAITSSTLITLFMRIGEGKIRNNMGMFMANYMVCVLMSRIFMGDMELFTRTEGISVAVGLGLFSGIMYLVSFAFMQWNIRANGVVLTSTFTKLGVLVPTLMAIFVFREQPKLLQTIGIIIAAAAIVMIHFEKEAVQTGSMKMWLIAQLLVSGFTDSLANIYDKAGNAVLKDHYLFYTFLAAFLLSFALGLRKKEKICQWDILFGILIGIPNYFSASFLLLALQSVPAIITYPVYSVGTIVAISAASVVLFKEKISSRKRAALVLVMLSLVFLNL